MLPAPQLLVSVMDYFSGIASIGVQEDVLCHQVTFSRVAEGTTHDDLPQNVLRDYPNYQRHDRWVQGGHPEKPIHVPCYIIMMINTNTQTVPQSIYSYRQIDVTNL